MIAIAILFMCTFAILGLVSSTLENARHLQRPLVDASALVNSQLAITNQLAEGNYSGNLGDTLGKAYQDYTYDGSIVEVQSNKLFQADFVIQNARGKQGHRLANHDLVLPPAIAPPAVLMAATFMSMRIPPSHRSRAFTLIEIMVAIALFMMIIMAIYSTWAVVMRATQVGQAAAARSQRERVALNTLENSLMCIQSFQASQRYYSFNVVSGDAPVLSFASRLPEGFPRNHKFGDFNLRRLTYSLEPATGGSKNLVLRQNPILMDMDQDEQTYPLVLARNVKQFLVECWDTNQLDWVTDWDNTNSIPPMLRVS